MDKNFRFLYRYSDLVEIVYIRTVSVSKISSQSGTEPDRSDVTRINAVISSRARRLASFLYENKFSVDKTTRLSAFHARESDFVTRVCSARNEELHKNVPVKRRITMLTHIHM